MTRRAWLLFAMMSLLWGLPYLFIKIAVDEFSPFAIVWLRCGIAAVVLLPLAVRSGVLGQLRGRWGPVALLTTVEIIAPFSLISAGEQHITSSLTGLLIAAMPLFVAVLAIRLAPSERVGGLRLVGLVVGLVGVALLLGLDVGGDSTAMLGAAMVLAATVCYGLSVLLVKRAFAGVSPLAITTVTVSIAAVVLTPLGLVGLPDHSPAVGDVSAIVALGLFCTAIAMVAYFALIGLAGASRASVVTYVNPAVAVALGVAVLGEPLTAATGAGFLLIIAGSWLSTGGTLPPRLLRRVQRAREEVATGREGAVASCPAPL